MIPLQKNMDCKPFKFLPFNLVPNLTNFNIYLLFITQNLDQKNLL